jgi:hypothetical protein
MRGASGQDRRRGDTLRRGVNAAGSSAQCFSRIYLKEWRFWGFLIVQPVDL